MKTHISICGARKFFRDAFFWRKKTSLRSSVFGRSYLVACRCAPQKIFRAHLLGSAPWIPPYDTTLCCTAFQMIPPSHCSVTLSVPCALCSACFHNKVTVIPQSQLAQNIHKGKQEKYKNPPEHLLAIFQGDSCFLPQARHIYFLVKIDQQAQTISPLEMWKTARFLKDVWLQ